MSPAASPGAAVPSPEIGVVSARAFDFRLGLDCPVMFAGDLVHALFEPDPERAERMRACNPQPERITVLPFALHDTAGNAAFRVTADPSCSTLLEVDESCGAYFGESTATAPGIGREGFDIPLRSRMKVERTLQVRTQTLDGMLGGHGLPVAFSPDVLYLDAAGGEHQALAGARRCLEEHTLEVTVRADLLPRFRGQQRFGESHAMLESAGFRLCALDAFEAVATRPLAPQVRARELPARARCVYLRRVDSPWRGDGDALHVKALKLAFLSVLHGQFALALDALEAAAASPPSAAMRSRLARLSYPAFLERFSGAITRSAAAAAMPAAPPPGGELPARGGPAQKLAGLARRLRRTWIVLNGGVPDFPGLRSSAAAVTGANAATELEKLLRFQGFWTLADEVQQRRLHARARRESKAP